MKDTVYRFLKTTTINWRAFLLRLSAHIASAHRDLVSLRRSVWILNTTGYERSRSKLVEGLSRITDSRKCFVFRLLMSNSQ